MNQIIRELNQKILNSIEENSSIGLAHGKMGLCIYFFQLSKMNEYASYKNEAEKILDDIYSMLNYNSSKDIESGLAGIALGIRFLIKEGFVDGNINDVLEDIDNNIYSYLSNINESTNLSLNEFQIIQLLLYYSIRLDDQEKDSDNYFIFKELIIILINTLDYKTLSSLSKEEFCFTLYDYHLPFYLFVLSRLLNQGIYTYKIRNMLKSIKLLILSHIPILGSNKLLLLTGLLYLSHQLPSEEYRKHMLRIKQHIDIDEIIYKELNNQDIFFSNGISSIYVLLRVLEIKFPEWKMDYDKKNFYKRISASEAWESLKNKDFFFNIHRGLFNGITGVILVLDLIENDIENEKL
jgi:hypothetical protein